MREIFATAAGWLDQRRPFALATLVALRDAKTAPIGTTVAVDLEGHIAGNIGAGCFETEIVEAALATAADGTTRRLAIDLDAGDELLGGNACGAVMQLIVWRPVPSFAEIARAIVIGERPVSLAIEDFEHVFEAKPHLVLVGATALAQDLASIARRAEFHVVVVDPRPAFATAERLPDANEIVHAWPDVYLPGHLSYDTSVVVLSHDPKLDIPALAAALRTPAHYIGLLGSRRAQASRKRALQSMGFDDRAVDRIHGPVGLDIGGTTTAETAISIMAEIVATRSGRNGMALVAARGDIH
ncbi:MAG TPA: XdhC family protein [Candidatus Baltobacteraceae bacterium]|nr:XdhC family protein [Candidatus Baltobacteraceae bacterium]